MSLGIFGIYEVDIIGGNNLNVISGRQFFYFFNSSLLKGKNLHVGLRVISFMPLYFEIKILSEDVEIASECSFRTFSCTVKYLIGYLTCQAG